MAILKIARMGHPVLASPAQPVEDPTAPAIRMLVADMLETMQDAGGTGLAAPQVHVPLRLMAFFVSGARAAREDDPTGEARPSDLGELAVPLTVLCNPVIEPLGEATTEGWEACLSVPGLTGLVPRYSAVRYRGVTPEGTVIEREARGFHARVVQHEADHLDGILYPQRMCDLGSLIFTSELKYRLAAEAPEPEARRAAAD
ncbi:MAG: peptide deformylase [Kiloniellales bacterium]